MAYRQLQSIFNAKKEKEGKKVIGRVLKGHLCPASQIASHMQVNPSVHEGSLFMSRATTGNSLG